MTVDCIFMDLDGTLYDLDDVIRSVYQMQVDFLKANTDMTELQIIQWFEENRVYPYKTAEARSATALFAEAGIDKQLWSRYKDEYLDVSDLRPVPEVNEALLQKLSQIAPVCLVSSNTMANIDKILGKLGLSRSLFSAVVSSDSVSCEGGFCKDAVFARIAEDLGVPMMDTVSIGDRFATDIEPLLQLGGKGILLHKPSALPQVCSDLQADTLRTCDGYSVYGG